MRIVYLDQNKWIDLARAAKRPADYPDLWHLLEAISPEISACRLILPLSFSNVYEARKINDPEQRHDLAFLQAAFSRGFVFRSRRKCLQEEISKVFHDCSGKQSKSLKRDWFLTDNFCDWVVEYTDKQYEISNRVITAIRQNPSKYLYEFLATAPDEERHNSVKKFSAGSEYLRLRIEERRSRDQNESLSMRRKIYSALMLIEEIDLILRLAREVGIGASISDIGKSTVRRLATDVPMYYIEREIALRLEQQNRPIEENDFRDMLAFCVVIAYADEVIAEKQFISLAKQAKLHAKYNTKLSTDLFSLIANLP
jgi:hypothetical protein